jgi:hypothetical protein
VTAYGLDAADEVTLRAGVATAAAVHTDDTGFRMHGKTAHLMSFDTDEAMVYQIRRRHRNEEVRELVPSHYAGVMVTDRGKSYDAKELLGVRQQKCLDRLKEIHEVLEGKTGRARSFGLKLKSILRSPPTVARLASRKGQAVRGGGETD